MDTWTTAFSISIVVVAAVVMGTLIVAVATPGRFTRVTGAIRRSFWCQHVDRPVTAEICVNMRTGQAVDVAWCTAFTPAVAVRCGKPCLLAPAPARPRAGGESMPRQAAV